MMSIYTLLFTVSVLCFVSVYAQFGPVQNFQLNGGRTDLERRRQLSPQQQGHILSDIQQHQHRFQLHQQQQGLGRELNLQQFQFNIPQQQQTIVNQQQQSLPNRNQISFPSTNDQQHPESLLQPQLPLVHQNHQFNSHTNGQNQQFFDQQNQHALTSSIATPVLNQQTQFPLPTQASFLNQQQNFRSNFLTQQSTNSPTKVVPSVSPILPTDSSAQLSNFFDPEKQQQRLKELRLKQQIIDKHNQFVEKQYEKSLKKAQDDHQEWLENQREQRKKLYQSLYRPEGPRILNYSGPRPRYIFPEEETLFQKALENYYREHPTTTTTTTTTTTPTPPTTKKTEIDPQLHLQNNRQKLFYQLKSSLSGDSDSTEKHQFLPTALPEPTAKPIKSIEQLDLLQRQYQQQLLQRDDLLRQLKQAIADNKEDEPSKNFTSREISLANGQTVQIIKTSDPKLIPGATPITSESIKTTNILQLANPSTTTTTTSKPPGALLEELKGVLPPGADFEVLKHNSNGGVEELGNLPSNLPNQKKVTFVLLEEQQDGSYKVQGVRGNNGNDQKDKESVDVDSILKRIKNGEIKLPPRPSNEVSSTPLPSNDIKAQSTIYPTPSHSPKYTTSLQSTNRQQPKVNIYSNSNTDSVKSSNAPAITTNIGTQFLASSPHTTSPRFSTTPSTVSRQNYITHPTAQTHFHSSTFFPSSTEQIKIASTSSTQQKPYAITYGSSTRSPQGSNQQASVNVLQSRPASAAQIETDSNEFLFSTSEPDLPLADLLKKKGMYAMAKFLKQSGLDTILNETGPYTIFIPTDKAFRNLLIQLGGPEKAEEKFKENPRLLSGLLLHHVIPGAFEIKNLQDEMTGVSLAGTQLRVNQYAMQDVEWNEIKVTTINGAKIVEEKQDIEIPQGIAHAIDRVMFPLPVGDIVQTLQSDRERRFTTFLRILFGSGLAETLQGSKTYTLFAPVDRAFTSLSSDQINHIITDKAVAREFVMRHTITGTLYTNGMRYYQIRESLQPDKQITINKNSGRIKINNNSIVTQNVPATNGVIHALDALL